MYLMIDNYDSFVYNLKAYFQELGREILVKRCDEITLEDIEKMQPEGIILSPGPKRPWDAVLCVETVRQFQGQIKDPRVLPDHIKRYDKVYYRPENRFRRECG